MLTPKETAATCVAHLKSAKAKAVADGKTLSWQEVGQIIEHACQATPVFGQDKATSSEIGDKNKIPPLPAWVTAYSASIGYPLDGEAWCDSYEVKGWRVGKAKMKNWQAAVRTWRANGYGQGGIALAGATQRKVRDYSKLS